MNNLVYPMIEMNNFSLKPLPNNPKFTDTEKEGF